MTAVAVGGEPSPSSATAGVLGDAAAKALAWLDDLQPERRGEWGVRAWEKREPLADSPARLVAVDRFGLPRAIVFVASPAAPGLVERAAERAAAAKELLGEEVGGAVLSPVRKGWVDGLSIAAYPWRLEVARGRLRARLRRPFVRAWVLSWLRGVVKACSVRYEGESAEGVSESLPRLAGVEGLSRAFIEDVERSRERLESGAWRPRLCLDHNDVWPGNVMVNRDHLARPAGPSRYVLIDWDGANLRGFGFFDLVRASRGFGVGARRLSEELDFHAATLGIERADAMSQLMASLAWLHDHIEEFPLERFIAMAEGVHGTMHGALLRVRWGVAR